MRLILLMSLSLPAVAQAQTPIWRSPADTSAPDLPITVRPDASPVGRELRDIRSRIDSGRESGTLSKREGRALGREAQMLEQLGERYGRDGLSDAERRELGVRVQVLRDGVDAQRRRSRR